MPHIVLKESILDCNVIDTVTEESGLFLKEPIIGANNKGDGIIIIEDNGMVNEHNIELIINGQRGDNTYATYQYKDIGDNFFHSNEYGGYQEYLFNNADELTNGVKIKLHNLKIINGGDTDSSKLFLRLQVSDGTNYINIDLRFSTTGLKVYDNIASSQVGSTLTHDLTNEHDFIIAIKDIGGTSKISLYYRNLNDTTWTSVFINQTLSLSVSTSSNSILGIGSSELEHNNIMSLGNIIINTSSDDSFTASLPATQNVKESLFHGNIKSQALSLSNRETDYFNFTGKYNMYPIKLSSGSLSASHSSCFDIGNNKIGITYLMCDNPYQTTCQNIFIYYVEYNYVTGLYSTPLLIDTITTTRTNVNIADKSDMSIYQEDSNGLNPGRIWINFFTVESGSNIKSYLYYSDNGIDWNIEIDGTNFATNFSSNIVNSSIVIKNNYILCAITYYNGTNTQVTVKEWQISISSSWNLINSINTGIGNSAITWKNSGNIASLYWIKFSTTIKLFAQDYTESLGWSTSGGNYTVYDTTITTNFGFSILTFYNDLSNNIGFIVNASTNNSLSIFTRDNKSTWNHNYFLSSQRCFFKSINNCAFINNMPIVLFSTIWQHKLMDYYSSYTSDIVGLYISEYAESNFPDNESDIGDQLLFLKSFSKLSVSLFDDDFDFLKTGNLYSLYYDTYNDEDLTTRIRNSSNAPSLTPSSNTTITDNILIRFIATLLETYGNDTFLIQSDFIFSGCSLFSTSPSDFWKSLIDNNLQRITFDAELINLYKFHFNSFALLNTNMYEVIIKADNNTVPNWTTPGFSKTINAKHPETNIYNINTVNKNYIAIDNFQNNRPYLYIDSYIKFTSGALSGNVYKVIDSDGYGLYINADLQTLGAVATDDIIVYNDRMFGLVDNNFNESSIKHYRHLAIEIPAQKTNEGYYQIGKFIFGLGMKIDYARSINYNDTESPNITLNRSIGGQVYPRLNGESVFSTSLFWNKIRAIEEKELNSFLSYIGFSLNSFAFINQPGTFQQNELNNFRLLRLSNEYDKTHRLGDDSIFAISSIDLVEDK
jgi:hypothetical protein